MKFLIGKIVEMVYRKGLEVNYLDIEMLQL